MRAEAEAEAEPLVPLQAAQARLLDLIPPQGGRVTDLARLVRVSKQGLGHLVMQLAQRGYVELTVQPADKRAKLIRRTATGDDLQRAMRASLAVVEERWSAEVGADRYAIFRDVLSELVATADS